MQANWLLIPAHIYHKNHHQLFSWHRSSNFVNSTTDFYLNLDEPDRDVRNNKSLNDQLSAESWFDFEKKWKIFLYNDSSLEKTKFKIAPSKQLEINQFIDQQQIFSCKQIPREVVFIEMYNNSTLHSNLLAKCTFTAKCNQFGCSTISLLEIWALLSMMFFNLPYEHNRIFR